MVVLADLWLPILLSAVLVFIVSAILHMMIPIHKGDHRKLPGEERLLEAMRKEGISPGEYVFPCAGTMKQMGTPVMVEKYHKGPVGFLTVQPSRPPAMGRSLVLWFLFSIVVGTLVGYAAEIGLDRGAEYMLVFRLTATVAILGYGVAYIHHSIWRGTRWTTTLKYIFDGVVYGLVTAGVFTWLWPDAM